ncbi:MAG: MFS transporter [Ignisphaera sp.]
MRRNFDVLESQTIKYLVYGFFIYFILGTILVWSIFRPWLHRRPYFIEPNLSVLPFSISLLTFGLTMAFTGYLYAKNLRTTTLIGSLFIGLGYMTCSVGMFFPSLALYMIIIGFGILVGIGTGFLYNVPVVMIGQSSLNNKGTVLGSVLMGFGVSALIMSPVIDIFIRSFNISSTFLILGVTYMSALFYLGLTLNFSIKSSKPLSSNKMFQHIGYANFSKILKDKNFYFLWTVYAIGVGIGQAIIGYAKLIAIDITGLKDSLDYMATFAVSVLAIGNTILRPFYGKLIDLIGPKWTLTVTLIIQMFCLIVLLPNANNPTTLYLSLFLFGSTYGAYFVIMPIFTSYIYKTEFLGQAYGVLFTAYGIGGFTIPIFFSRILNNRNTLDAYIESFYSLTIFIIIALILTLHVKPKNMLKSLIK